jgi:acyl-CoA dehydrogenase
MFPFSNKVQDLREQLLRFMEEQVYPNEMELFRDAHNQPHDFRDWQPPGLLEELKEAARARGLWNLFLPGKYGAGLSNYDYAPLAEIMGRSCWAPEIFNCDAPNTGNIEVLVHYGSEEQKRHWLDPLLEGRIRSAFAMTEPEVASSDATNIRTKIRRDGDHYIITGRKWWTSGAGDPRCKLLITMGLTDSDNSDRHRRHSMILVPTEAPGVTIRRYLPVLGFREAPHGHMETIFDEVRVPATNLLLGEGRGFEIAQGRLGPGRIHHCMRMIGVSERALERMCRRLSERVAFGKPIAQHSVWEERIADARCAIDQARLLTLNAAWKMDQVGNKEAKAEIAMIKIVVPTVTARVVDMAIQAFGGGGVADAVLAQAYIYARAGRIVDGPDEVHRAQLARLELKKCGNQRAERTGASTAVTVTQGVDHLPANSFSVDSPISL